MFQQGTYRKRRGSLHARESSTSHPAGDARTRARASASATHLCSNDQSHTACTPSCTSWGPPASSTQRCTRSQPAARPLQRRNSRRDTARNSQTCPCSPQTPPSWMHTPHYTRSSGSRTCSPPKAAVTRAHSHASVQKRTGGAPVAPCASSCCQPTRARAPTTHVPVMHPAPPRHRQPWGILLLLSHPALVPPTPPYGWNFPAAQIVQCAAMFGQATPPA